jgi:hypothetical protein
MATPKPKPKPEKWQPTASDIITIVALVGAVVMWYVQPDWQIGAPVTVITIAVVIAAAVRHQSHPLVRIPVACAVVLALVAVAWRPIWTSFRKDYPRATINWPVTLNPPEAPKVTAAPADPPDMPPTTLPGPALSKFGKAMFLCQLPENIPAQDPEAVLAEIRRNLDILGNATGLSFVINRIPYGFRLDVTENGPEGQLRMGGAQRFTVQIERSSQGAFVTISIDLAVLGILSMMPLDAEAEKMFRKLASQFISTAEDKCRLL